MVNSRGNDLDDRVYTLTTYIAAPGTPIIDPATGQRSESFPGHMYYMISDGSEVSGYGFAPIRHTMLGRGEVSPNDFLRYQVAPEKLDTHRDLQRFRHQHRKAPLCHRHPPGAQ